MSYISTLKLKVEFFVYSEMEYAYAGSIWSRTRVSEWCTTNYY